ncbi:TBC1 domain member isoform cra_b [Ichthyophthirius multifiliis]|uniref:TBC1 domain member isoform cra_b n=1 Tax=Ichthyophthirius multifiliis TaxID=5932 RepID=G0QP06_ICHMU|nr:TBC1 domain member isoform cra_b [Ichthyophthirius multifiliis]EGR33049.1 TBC1 domain member isoform cra_b [Ichthyophthirius multifiliis]|eukprot:XP_004037035.1 TBC1 domain member isoform cra_b [Ichthyophthirius multifiliis]
MDTEQIIISCAKINDKHKQEFPDLEQAFSFSNFQKYILNSLDNIDELLDILKNIQLENLQIRFNVWRILLGIFQSEQSQDEKLDQLKKHRQEYKQLWESYNKQILKQENKPKQVFNPLAKNIQNTVRPGYFEDNELKSEIKKDVDRTYQDKPFFNNLNIKQIMSNILFVYSKKNNDVSYRQGMNELIASFLVIYFSESLYIKNNQYEDSKIYEIAQSFINPDFAEADVYQIFNKMMEAGHLEMFRPYLCENAKKKSDYNISSKKQQAILIRIGKIQNHYLKIIDIELFKHIKLLNVEMQIFLLRWIRCVHTREYHLSDSFLIWDSIFFEYFQNKSIENNFFLIDCICLAMIQFVRQQILEKEESSDCLQRFLKFPPVENIKSIIEQSFQIKANNEIINILQEFEFIQQQ